MGAFVGGFIAGFIMEKIGRKKMLWIVTSANFFIGYVFIFFAADVWMLYIGRFFGGVGLGFQVTTSAVYVVEISTIDMRGFLGCFIQLLGCLGIIFTFIFGYFFNWKLLAVANSVWAVVFSIMMLQAPESPRWLILKVN